MVHCLQGQVAQRSEERGSSMLCGLEILVQWPEVGRQHEMNSVTASLTRCVPTVQWWSLLLP